MNLFYIRIKNFLIQLNFFFAYFIVFVFFKIISTYND